MSQHFETGGLHLADVPTLCEHALSVDFDFATVDREAPPTEGRDWEHAAGAMRRVFEWVYSPPKPNADGLLCRAAFASWVFCPELRSLSMTQLAGRIGRKKQSLGRFVPSFCEAFPEVAAHLQHLRNHE